MSDLNLCMYLCEIKLSVMLDNNSSMVFSFQVCKWDCWGWWFGYNWQRKWHASWNICWKNVQIRVVRQCHWYANMLDNDIVIISVILSECHCCAFFFYFLIKLCQFWCFSDLCPVGALTSKPYAFTSRPWELRCGRSICQASLFCYSEHYRVAFKLLSKTIPKWLLRPITTGANNAMNQPEFLTITCNVLKVGDKLCVQGVIGFGFTSKLVEKLVT